MKRQIWLTFSLRKKVRLISMTAVAVVLLSILVNVLVSVFGLGSLGSILEGNSKSLRFWSAIEAEQSAFQNVIRDSSDEVKQRYQDSCHETERALSALPFDYKLIGQERYAKTWSIRNLYGAYSEARDRFLLLSKEDESYGTQFYDIIGMQRYLSVYAGDLEELNVKAGTGEYKKLQPYLKWILAASIVWGFLALWLVWRLNRSVNQSIVKPVVALAEDSKRIGENDFTGREPTACGQDEIAMLVRAFVQMKTSTRDYIDALNRNYEMEKQLESVRLQMLKNQINPHFLFNTLNMIAGTAQIEDAVTTEKMISALSRLFRYNLKSTDAVMPLERELKVISDYIYLQKMRFGQRIQYSTDCQEETMEVLIPVFALQPLVENAIIHGLSSKSQGGKIHIRSWLAEGKIWILVADTGVGIPKDKLKEMRMALEEGEENKTGIGVGNIYRRIHSMYQDGQVTIDSVENCGTTVQIVFTADNRR